MSKFPWLHDAIFGEPPSKSPTVAKLPIIDDPAPLFPRAHIREPMR